MSAPARWHSLALVHALLRWLLHPALIGTGLRYLTAEYSHPADVRWDFIEANGIAGNALCALRNWGGYIHWRTDGRLKVYVDGRADTIYDGDTLPPLP